MTVRRAYTKPGEARYTWGTHVNDAPAPSRTDTDYAHGWTGDLDVAGHGELRDGTGWRVAITSGRAAGRYALTLTTVARGDDVPGCKLRAALETGIVSCDLRAERGGLVGLVRGVLLRGTASGRMGAWRLDGEAVG